MNQGKPIKLRSYQQRGRDGIKNNLVTALFFKMGYGKTLSALTAIYDLIRDSFEVQKVLILAPKRVATVAWPKQIQLWEGINTLRAVVVHGNKLERIRQDADIYIMSYSSLQWLYKMVLKRTPGLPKFDLIVYDESTYVKHQSSNRWKICNALFRDIPRKVLLAGKPAPNSLLDLWAQVYLLDNGDRLFRNFTDFRNLKFMATGNGPFKRYVPMQGTSAWIAQQLSDIAITVMDSDEVEVPPLVNNFVMCSMDDKDFKQYKKLERDTLLEFPSGDISASSAASLTMKLRQFVQGFLYGTDGQVEHLHEAKLDVLVDVLDQAQDDNVLIAIQFKEDVQILKRRFPDLPVINSDTSDKDAEYYLEEWNAGRLPRLAVQPDSVAHGLNIQDGGHTLVYYGLTWNLDYYEQLIARLHRSGQTHKVVVHHIVMADTIDEVVLNTIDRKATTQDGLLAMLEEYRERLSNGA